MLLNYQYADFYSVKSCDISATFQYCTMAQLLCCRLALMHLITSQHDGQPVWYYMQKMVHCALSTYNLFIKPKRNMRGKKGVLWWMPCSMRATQTCHKWNNLLFLKLSASYFCSSTYKEPTVNTLTTILLWSYTLPVVAEKNIQSIQLHKLNLKWMYTVSECMFSSANSDRFYLWNELTALPLLRPMSTSG